MARSVGGVRARTMAARIGRTSGRTREALIACCAFAALRLLAVGGRPPVRYPDSDSYFYVDFLGHAAGGRLWTVPLVFTALPTDTARVVVQALIAIGCWSALALTLAHVFRRRSVARAAVLLALLLGLCVQVTEWDQTILSESLALSLTALLTAALLWLQAKPTSVRRQASLLAVLTLWLFARQLHVLVYLPVATVAIAWIAVRCRRLLPLAVALAVLGVWSGYATAQDEGHVIYGAHDITTVRILQTADGPEYLKRAGMPDLPALEQEAATYADKHVVIAGSDSHVYTDPVWRAWVLRRWTPVFAQWLLRHPELALRGPLNESTTLLDGFPNYGSIRSVLPGPVQDLLWERTTGSLPFWIVGVGTLWLISLRRARPGRLDVVAALSLLACVLWYFEAWHLQVTELPRLMVPVALAFRIGLLVVALASVERGVGARRTSAPAGQR